MSETNHFSGLYIIMTIL